MCMYGWCHVHAGGICTALLSGIDATWLRHSYCSGQNSLLCSQATCTAQMFDDKFDQVF